jgi:phage shock protein PspC (stress-responsive transcriptional regulator)
MPGGVPGFLLYFILWMIMPAEDAKISDDVIEGEVIR